MAPPTGFFVKPTVLVFDDLHCPHPLSPMFYEIGGWWLTCDHMFRRFGTPFACDWIAKEINGYVYTAAVPADSRIKSEATEYQARYARERAFHPTQRLCNHIQTLVHRVRLAGPHEVVRVDC